MQIDIEQESQALANLWLKASLSPVYLSSGRSLLTSTHCSVECGKASLTTVTVNRRILTSHAVDRLANWHTHWTDLSEHRKHGKLSECSICSERTTSSGRVNASAFWKIKAAWQKWLTALPTTGTRANRLVLQSIKERRKGRKNGIRKGHNNGRPSRKLKRLAIRTYKHSRTPKGTFNNISKMSNKSSNDSVESSITITIIAITSESNSPIIEKVQQLWQLRLLPNDSSTLQLNKVSRSTGHCLASSTSSAASARVNQSELSRWLND